MRLINIKSLEFKEFFGHEVPPYAILSHRWGREEILYHDFRQPERRRGHGYEKVVEFCKATERYNQWLSTSSYYQTQQLIERYDKDRLPGHIARKLIEYVWIDTCCINKTSSAELQEAINGMFGYYQKAEICFVHLADVRFSPDDQHAESNMSLLAASEWFTRGWTLQEFLAPNFILICDGDWNLIGHKCLTHGEDRSLCRILPESTHLNKQLADICNIEPDYIDDPSDIAKASVATKLSWAASRRTTRVEDTAYSLVGLLGITMSMVYSEGHRAFARLQEEIIKATPDETIYIHTDSGPSVAERRPMLARRIEDFACSAGFRNVSDSVAVVLLPGYVRQLTPLEPWSLHQGMLRLQREMLRVHSSMYSQPDETWLLPLHCTEEAAWETTPSILLVRRSLSSEFSRVPEACCPPRLGPFTFVTRSDKGSWVLQKPYRAEELGTDDFWEIARADRMKWQYGFKRKLVRTGFIKAFE